MNASKKIQKAPSNEASVAEALGAGAVLVVLFGFLNSPEKTWFILNQISAFSERNETAVLVLFGLAVFTLVWIASALAVAFRKRPGRTAIDIRAGESVGTKEMLLGALLGGALGALLSLVLAKTVLIPHGLELLPFPITSRDWSLLFTSMGFSAWSGVGLLFGRSPLKIWVAPFGRLDLPKVPTLQDGIILGSVNEGESRKDAEEKRTKGLFPDWITVGLRSLTGNLFITGVIGSGKTQALLQLLKQIFSNFTKRPALLAIDPKRTFVRELRRIIETLGMGEHLVWVSLQGDVRMNPVWCENMLKNSGFTTIANSLKFASINFIGTSGDSKFWEQSSFNLLKNALIYCAAKYDYFTFKELYRALVEARDEGLASSLVDCLNERQWDEEERGNIESAVQYFTNEFSQMDEKIRTSILATATSFLNDFLEYRVSRILSPRKEEINFPSFKEAIRDGKLICLNIENDALARSIGTLIKLLYQEAVLDRVTDGDLGEARYALLVMDEYQDVATSGGGGGIGDDRYLAKARESKSITIAATQSVSSLENTIKSESATRELLQGFRSRIFGNSTDPKTIRSFQEPRGTEEIERSSHNFSETAPDARGDLLFGGFDSERLNVSQGVSTHLTREFPVTAKEFSRLRTFEAFAQIFDGLETRFEKLYLKPYFLKDLRTSHRKILEELRKASEVKRAPAVRWSFLWLIFGLSVLPLKARADALFPNICSVIKSQQFRQCLDFSVGACMCGWPVPRPCAKLSYYVPQTFIEVWPNSAQSFFGKLPGAAAQIGMHGKGIPFGADDEMGAFAFHAHAIPVPFGKAVMFPMPCGGTRLDKPCFDLMSEDLGQNWSTGAADLLQPKYLAWRAAPKACLLKGAISGIVSGTDVSTGSDNGGCSFPLSYLPKYPPSMREACNGWGLFYPRSGTYQGASRVGAALMVASRLKSIGAEVSHTLASDPDEQWQMLFPQASSCFKEGENIGFLETARGVREEGRLLGKPNGFLFVVYRQVSCCRDLAEIATTQAAIAALSVACQAMPGGDV